MEAARDRLVDRVHAHRHVGGGHDDRHALRRVFRIGRHVLLGKILGRPLPCPGRALDQFPFVAEEHVEVAVVPLRRVRRPGAFDATGDRIAPLAAAESADPAKPHLLERRGFRLGADVCCVTGTMGLAEGVTARRQRDRLLVVHRHAGEGLADIATRGDRVRLAVGPLRVHVDQAHLHRRERFFEFALAAVALVTQPLGFGAPVDVLFGRPDVLPSAAETEGLEAHRFECDVAGENHQVGPRNALSVLLLDRPEQPTRLVEVGVVGPAVERGEALRAGARTAATIRSAIGAGAVPGHADEQAAVVAVVGRPPVLRGRHQCVEVLLDRRKVESGERLGIVEGLAHRVRQGRMLMEDAQIELVRPPVAIRRAAGSRSGERAVHDRAFALGFDIIAFHVSSPVVVPPPGPGIACHGAGNSLSAQAVRPADGPFATV